jgi:hypothetical protein
VVMNMVGEREETCLKGVARTEAGRAGAWGTGSVGRMLRPSLD